MISTPANVEPEIVAPTKVAPTIVEPALENEAPTVNQEPSALTEVTRRIIKQALPVLPEENPVPANQATKDEKRSVTSANQVHIAGEALTDAASTGITGITGINGAAGIIGVTAITAAIFTAAIVFARRGQLGANLLGWRGRIRVRKPAF